MEQESHFAAVLKSPVIQQTLQRHNLNQSEIYRQGGYRHSLLHNGGLKIWKDSWTVPLPAPGIDGVTVHFESRRPGEFQVDVEVFPYEGGIEKDGVRRAELAEQLEIKARLIRQLREWVLLNTSLADRLGATTHRLRSDEAVSTLCAVKFVSGHGPDTSADTDARYIARVIDSCAPVIDRIVSGVRG